MIYLEVFNLLQLSGMPKTQIAALCEVPAARLMPMLKHEEKRSKPFKFRFYRLIGLSQQTLKNRRYDCPHRKAFNTATINLLGRLRIELYQEIQGWTTPTDVRRNARGLPLSPKRDRLGPSSNKR